MRRIIVSSALFLFACESPPPPEAKKPASEGSAAREVDPSRLAMFQPLPEAVERADIPLTEEEITLGRMLWYDKRLSKAQDISCNTCHLLAAYGVDGKPVSEGHKKKLGKRNAPSAYTAAGHFVQFWDGRAKTVEEQALKPIVNPDEMAMANEKAVLDVLRSMPEYVAAFKKAFPADKDALTFKNVGIAIGAFERKLMTPGRWDKFLKGDKNALKQDEKDGFNKFVEVGCIACHTGPYAGGHMFQKLGLVKPYPSTKDQGRFEETKAEADKMMFKVPTLRNVEKTGPYFHDGSVATLEEAVKLMATYQLGRDLKDEDVKSIVAWLKSLTGEIPTGYIAEPTLPPSSKTTPKPN